MIASPFVIRVDFPALDALVAYLNGAQQPQIDALAEQVAQLKQTLDTSTSALQESVNKGV